MALNSLIRRGRKAKIILVLASHDPTLKTTKANVNGIESRIAFRCLKHQNSSAALGVVGAEKLPGGGAMLFKSQGSIHHLQGSWVTDEETEQILSTAPVGHDDIDKLKIIEPEMAYLPITDNEMTIKNAAIEKINKELANIIIWVLSQEKISASRLQKLFRMSKRADDVLDKLHKMGFITEKFSNQPRTVLPTCYEDLLPETVAFLERYGYTEENIRNAFSIKNGEA